MITYIHKQKVSPLISDKASFTLVVNQEHEEDIAYVMNELITSGHAKKTYKGMYWLSIEVLLGAFNEQRILVQCKPKKTEMSFFRVEFNPSKVNMAEVRSYVDLILPYGYTQLIKQGVCTRIDATVDVHNVEIDNLLIWMPSIRKTSGYYKDGKTETYYLGPKASPRLICIYDKVAEIKARNSKKLIKTEVPDHPITRIELRLKTRPPAKALPGIPNLFKKIGISNIGAHMSDDHAFRMFIKASRAEGAQNVLLDLPEELRKKYRKRLATGSPQWWDTDNIWTQWPNVANAIINPPACELYTLLKQDVIASN